MEGKIINNNSRQVGKTSYLHIVKYDIALVQVVQETASFAHQL